MTYVGEASIVQTRDDATSPTTLNRGRPPFPGIFAWRPDAVSLLSLVVFCMFVIPARFVVHGFGAVGTPSNLLGIVAFFLWAFARMRGSKPREALQPVRIITGIFFFAMLLTYATGFARLLFPDEASNATRFMIEILALTGIALVAADAISSRDRLVVLLQRAVYGAAFMGFAGDLEFFTKYNLAQHMRFPGLVLNNTIIGLRARGDGFNRVAGTASHYIEFGVVLGMMLPFAIHFAVFSKTRGRRHLNWLLAAIMGLGIPFSLSRAAALGLVVAMLGLAACWTLRARLNGMVCAVLFLVALKAAKPGLLGSLLSLFTHASTDPSIAGRTKDYPIAFALIGQRPLFGRGTGTFFPARYFTLDNQFLGTTIESGFVGLIALTALLVGATAIAHRVGKFASDPETKHLGYALLGAFLSAFVTSFLFDSLSFPIFATIFFLLLGVAGALWRLDRPVRDARYTVDTVASHASIEETEFTATAQR